MKYEKAMAEVVVFDNSDVLMDKSSNCAHNSSGKQCSNTNQGTAENCPNMNHGSMTGTNWMDESWLEG